MRYLGLVLALGACGGGNTADGDAQNVNGDGNGSSTGDAAPACDPGKIDVGAGCVPINANDPGQRAAADVCTRWKADHVLTDAHPFSANTAGDCDIGMLSTAGKADALKRLNLFRWLSGLGPTTEDAGLDATDQACANLEAWWDFTSTASPHAPPATTKCYTAQGASGAGMSNIAWGSGDPSQAMDQWVEDNGNATTMGHRRWIVNPPLGPIGLGYWQTGGTYGNAACLAVFGSSGTSVVPPWVAVPNPGPVPVEVAKWTWTFHSNLGGTENANIAVLRLSDHAMLAVTKQTLQQGYGQKAIAWQPMGWTPAAGETYRVTISGLTGGDVVYAVKPVTCN